MALLYVLDYYVVKACWILGMPVGAWAFIHAIISRPDAFAAADKQTKQTWLLITGIATALLVACNMGPGGTWAIFWIAALCASLVYLVDVRPSLIEVQGGRR